MQPGQNGADFAMDALAAMDQQDIDAAEIWRQSEAHRQAMATLESLCPSAGAGQEQQLLPVQPAAGKARATIGRQFRTLLRRAWRQQRRSREAVRTRLLSTFIMGLCLGVLFWQIPRNFQGAAACAVAVLFMPVVHATETAGSEVPSLIAERGMLYRELSARAYASSIYYLTRLLASMPAVLLQSLAMVLPLWPMSLSALAPWSALPVFALALAVTFVAATTLAHVAASVSPSDGVGNTVYTAVLTALRLGSGFIVLRSVMSWPLFPAYYAGPFHYALYASAASAYGRADTVFSCQSPDELSALYADGAVDPSVRVCALGQTADMLKNFSVGAGLTDMLEYLGSLGAIAVACAVVAATVLTFKRFESR
ncbi:MAG: hypothetical protein MHM6MM_006716 [Cercozoa sp. M6MM]